jgi:hypothetical protein
MLGGEVAQLASTEGRDEVDTDDRGVVADRVGAVCSAGDHDFQPVGEEAPHRQPGIGPDPGGN